MLPNIPPPTHGHAASGDAGASQGATGEGQNGHTNRPIAAGIGELPKRRQMDAVVAKVVFGLEVEMHGREPMIRLADDDGWKQWYALPRYSHDIAGAWLVVNALIGHARFLTLQRRDVGMWRASFTGGTSHLAPTPQEAICRAALAVMEAQHA